MSSAAGYISSSARWLAGLFNYSSPNADITQTFKETAPLSDHFWQKAHITTEPIPSIPSQLQAKLDEPCPFFCNKKIKESHWLIYLPEHLNQRKASPNSLRESLGYEADPYFFGDHGKKTIVAGYWFLILKAPIPDSYNKSFERQEQLARDKGYRVPSIIEAEIAAVIRKIEKQPIDYHLEYHTHCLETEGNWPISVGMSGGELYQSKEIRLQKIW